MKVSERIKELRRLLNEPEVSQPAIVSIVSIAYQVTQLEIEIVEALQVARHEGYKAGYVERGLGGIDD